MEVKVKAALAAVALAEDRVAKTVAVDSKAAVVSSPRWGWWEGRRTGRRWRRRWRR